MSQNKTQMKLSEKQIYLVNSIIYKADTEQLQKLIKDITILIEVRKKNA